MLQLLMVYAKEPKLFNRPTTKYLGPDVKASIQQHTEGQKTFTNEYVYLSIFVQVLELSSKYAACVLVMFCLSKC